MKKKSLLGIVADITLIILVFLVSFYLAFDFFKPELTVKFLGFKPYVVMSNSMEPEINVGDIVIVKRHDITNLKVGDIVTFIPRKNMYVTHYLAELRQENGKYYMRTRPYGMVERDRWDYQTLTEERYIGKSVFVIPFIGHIFLFFRTFYGIVTLLLIVIFILVLGKVRRKND